MQISQAARAVRRITINRAAAGSPDGDFSGKIPYAKREASSKKTLYRYLALSSNVFHMRVLGRLRVQPPQQPVDTVVNSLCSAYGGWGARKSVRQ